MSRPDVRAIVEALGFDPTNHHNALGCPYCNPDRLVLAARDRVAPPSGAQNEKPEGETHTFGGTYDDPPHCRDDYREVWRSGFRAGKEHSESVASPLPRATEPDLSKLIAEWRAMAKSGQEDILPGDECAVARWTMVEMLADELERLLTAPAARPTPLLQQHVNTVTVAVEAVATGAADQGDGDTAAVIREAWRVITARLGVTPETVSMVGTDTVRSA